MHLGWIDLRIAKKSGEQAGEIRKVGAGVTARGDQHAIFRQAQQDLGAADVAAEDHADILRPCSHWRGNARKSPRCKLPINCQFAIRRA